MRRSEDSIFRWNSIVDESVEAAERHRLPDGSKVLLDNIFPLESGAMNNIAPGGVCPFLGQEAWVSAEGRFDPCCAPDEQRRTLGGFGNLSSEALSEIWGGEDYLQLLKNYQQHPLCISCNMHKPKEGS